MPELRWILLIAGAVFLVALAIWEARRQRRRPPQAVEEPTHHRFREPTIGLPELRPRESAPELPVVEIDESMIGLRAEGMRAEGVRIEENLVAVDEPAGPGVAEPVAAAGVVAPAPARPAIPSASAGPGPSLDPGAYAAPDAGAGFSANADPAVPGLEPMVDWPPEEQRRFVTVRVAARAGEKLSGRAVRLALSAEGFVYGAFSMFHKPEPGGRAAVSAASLTQSGSFDLDAMDSQRYGGLAVFVVLPGPLPGERMIDELLEAARNLTQRLQAFLQDERGAPLDADRVAALRASAAAAAPSASAPAPPQPAGSAP